MRSTAPRTRATLLWLAVVLFAWARCGLAEDQGTLTVTRIGESLHLETTSSASLNTTQGTLTTDPASNAPVPVPLQIETISQSEAHLISAYVPITKMGVSFDQLASATFTLKLEGVTAPLSFTGRLPAAQPRPWLAKGAPLAGVVGAALSLAALGVVLLVNSKVKDLKGRATLWVTRDQLKDVESGIPGRAEQAAQDVLAKAANQGEPYARYKSLADQVECLRHDLRGLTQHVSELTLADNPVEEDLRAMAQAAMASSAEKEQRRAEIAGVATVGRSGQALAATVNRWTDGGGRGRGELVSLARRAGLAGARLARVDALGTPVDAQGEVECAVHFAEEGSWLFAPEPGSTGQYLAAPAEAQFMAMGTLPFLLNQMFEGMDGARQGFRFERILAPARLQARDDRMLLVARGALKLQGAAAPDREAPPPYEYFADARIVAPNPREDTAAAGERIARWIAETQQTLSRQQDSLETLQAGLAARDNEPAGVSREEFLRLSKTLTETQRAIVHLREETGRLAAAATATAGQAHGPASIQEALPQPPASSPARLPETYAVAEHKPPEPPAAIPPRGTRIVAESIAATSPPSRESLSQTFAAVLRRAAERPACQPHVTGMPPEQVYVERVRALFEEALAAAPELLPAVVHLRKDLLAQELEVHTTALMPEGRVRCAMCDTEQTWQLAVVCAVQPGTLAVLLPRGTLGKSNFATGYTVLMESTPSSVFTVGHYRPAELMAAPMEVGGQAKRDISYRVVRKMILHPESETA